MIIEFTQAQAEFLESNPLALVLPDVRSRMGQILLGEPAIDEDDGTHRYADSRFSAEELYCFEVLRAGIDLMILGQVGEQEINEWRDGIDSTVIEAGSMSEIAAAVSGWATEIELPTFEQWQESRTAPPEEKLVEEAPAPEKKK